MFDLTPAESLVLDDFLAVEGKILLAHAIHGFFGDDSDDIWFEEPIRVRVLAANDHELSCDLLRNCDEWIDPYYSVELVEPVPQLEGWTCLEVYGISRHEETGAPEIAKTDWRVDDDQTSAVTLYRERTTPPSPPPADDPGELHLLELIRKIGLGRAEKRLLLVDDPDPPGSIPSFLQEVETRETSLGLATYVRVGRHDDRPMSWTEVWEKFASLYPGKWAVQFFPPADRVVDEANRYHLYVLDEPPRGVDIRKDDT